MHKYFFAFVFFPGVVFSLNKFICEHSTDSISCLNGYALKIRSVNFGRTSKIVCSNDPTTNCYSSGRTTGYLANKCNGLNACQLTADSNVIGENPCPGVSKYLDLQYDCDPIPTTSTTTTTTTTTVAPVTQQTTTPQGAPQVCHEYLVSGMRGIPDNKLTASSTWSNKTNDDHKPHRSRLFTTAVDYANGTYLRGAWSAGVNDKNQYIQAELAKVSTVRGMVTQGQNVNPKDNCCSQKVSSYRVGYSVDGTTWVMVKNGPNDMIFPGNTDQDTPVTNMLPCPVIAKYIRLYPVKWDKHISLRWDAIGCPTDASPYGQCPAGWLERPGSNECYLITINKTKGYDDARQACRLEQGDLVQIDTVAERNWVIQQLNVVKNTKFPNNQLFQVWVGLSNRPRRDTIDYKWIDGTPHDTNIVPWLPNMPDNYLTIEHCGELVNSGLNDINCNNPINYVCEKKKYWNAPVNNFTPAVVIPTTPSTQVPSTIHSGIPIPIGGSAQTIGQSTFTRGCHKASDCRNLQLGDYQSCTGCHYYLTCAPSGDFVRPCPANLIFDFNSKACVARSGTCIGP
ncbi:uncharacterized protein LOC110454060 isoform X2 [Mizuhopecten yessoensis]|uniref:Inactive carboxypeptidase-like protein X2 n=1 Tax=Mizuhopecten yessoensis TaxID=6573 RepID=A0A210QGC6_MIZYE|nr:uncharacterized protein LOC110454060 isoform X1 [Mizuhopecten yessoensis]XP_021359073.1 uncharacterized protein LOC110454060 isoform X2 [Mizuhopecten yessoensis]OWF47671.1 Inactive carboxypeptidase-like protein X2 [Mizuhopecten yessoensis]